MENVSSRMQFTVKELEFSREETLQLKGKIAGLQEDLLGLREKLLMSNSEKSELQSRLRSVEDDSKRNYERERGMNEELRNTREELMKKAKEVETGAKKVVSLKAEIEKLRAERDQLLEVSQKYKLRIQKLEEERGEREEDEEEEHNPALKQSYRERVRVLESYVEDLQSQIAHWEGLNEKQEETIEKMRAMIQELTAALSEAKAGGSGTAKKEQVREISPPAREERRPMTNATSGVGQRKTATGVGEGSVARRAQAMRNIPKYDQFYGGESEVVPQRERRGASPPKSGIAGGTKEAAGAGNRGPGANNVPLVRNYNIRNDDEFKEMIKMKNDNTEEDDMF
eukprot:TRINITY_DN28606_c0_g1_i2.p1 TRINITY_DN28606_c0_g1~~TRINITY_DN28606_c0_g1_i2.p1  ORF type:complete len:341 (-),score=85.15 TRINITY_DN28606_c0_g1_i2:206-1228(-)